MCISSALIQLYLWKWNLWKCGKVQHKIFESFSFTFKNLIFVFMHNRFLQVFKMLRKGQLISKWLWCPQFFQKTNEKNRSNYYIWYLLSNCFRFFFRRIGDTKKTFRNSKLTELYLRTYVLTLFFEIGELCMYYLQLNHNLTTDSHWIYAWNQPSHRSQTIIFELWYITDTLQSRVDTNSTTYTGSHCIC